MKCFLINSFLTLAGTFAFAKGATTYQMKWLHPKLSIETEMFEGTLTLANRVSETGEYKGRDQLPILNAIKDGKVKATPGETKIIILVVKNKADKPLKFAVAPHNVDPIEASLGIKFNCLCNGHTYSVAANSAWYRIMELKTLKPVEALSEEVLLEHQIFPVK